MPAPALAALAVLVAAGLGLRVAGLDQSLYGDEQFTHFIVTRGGLGDVWHLVYTTSITPPFHYALAWLSVQLGGDSTVLVRLPSIVLGTALVPVVYALGARVAGVRAGLIAAALIALGPFSVWYADEARAYATMMFLLTLGAYGLLRAVRGGGGRWWALWAVCSCLGLWSHYTAVFVVVAGIAWAALLHPERRRAALLAAVGVAVGYAPWVPGFLSQRTNDLGIRTVEQLADFTPGAPFTAPARTLVGHPELGLADLPGAIGFALAAVALVLVVAAFVRARPRRGGREALTRDGALVALLAVATPAGLLLYAALGTSLWLPRNVSASLPFLSVAAGGVIAWASRTLPRPAGLAGLAVLGALLVAITVRSQGDAFRRAPYREAAHWVERRAATSDPVVEVPLALVPDPRLPPTTTDPYFDGGRRVIRTGDDAGAWRRLGSGADLWVVTSSLFSSTGEVRDAWGGRTPPPGLLARAGRVGGPDGLGLRREARHFDGIIDVDAEHFRGRASGRLSGGRIAWTLAPGVRVGPGAARGAVDSARHGVVEGWAQPATGHGLVDWVLAFRGGRLVAASAGGLRRPDVARLAGSGALHSGWRFRPLVPGGDLRGLRVFGVVGGRATELPVAPTVARALR